jgi:hypothetical protein
MSRHSFPGIGRPRAAINRTPAGAKSDAGDLQHGRRVSDDYENETRAGWFREQDLITPEKLHAP